MFVALFSIFYDSPFVSMYVFLLFIKTISASNILLHFSQNCKFKGWERLIMHILATLFIIIFTLTGCDNISQINFETTMNSPRIHAEFSTNITDKTPERLNNINIGVTKLNGAAVKPGETFSFNTHIGPRTKETGYQEAIIFDGHGNKID